MSKIINDDITKISNDDITKMIKLLVAEDTNGGFKQIIDSLFQQAYAIAHLVSTLTNNDVVSEDYHKTLIQLLEKQKP